MNLRDQERRLRRIEKTLRQVILALRVYDTEHGGRLPFKALGEECMRLLSAMPPKPPKGHP